MFSGGRERVYLVNEWVNELERQLTGNLLWKLAFLVEKLFEVWE